MQYEINLTLKAPAPTSIEHIWQFHWNTFGFIIRIALFRNRRDMNYVLHNTAIARANSLQFTNPFVFIRYCENHGGFCSISTWNGFSRFTQLGNMLEAQWGNMISIT